MKILEKISYNSPITLNYTFISLAILLISYIFPGLHNELFVLNSSTFNFLNPVDYITIISHALGHADFNHYMGNFTFILLLSPFLEEKYGSRNLLAMFILTSLFTGIIHLILFSSSILGASGNVFMVILLSSFAGKKNDNKIPLTFLLTFILFIGKEIIGTFSNDNIYHFGHIIGALVGTFFGYILHLNINKR